MSSETATATLAEQAFGVLQRAIVGGELLPGAKLKISDLEERFGLGATPLREGLSRLVTFGLVAAIGQRGFRVAEISPEDLIDITCARIAVETEALRLSIIRGDARWEGDIVSCLHQMTRSLEGTLDLTDEPPGFEDLHKDFHIALISGCQSPRLIELSSMLYDQALRYRRMMRKRGFATDEFIDHHRELSGLVLERRIDDACASLKLHLASSYRAIYGPLPQSAQA
jgi:GntR family carbon starvation induced transcriptional regulator